MVLLIFSRIDNFSLRPWLPRNNHANVRGCAAITGIVQLWAVRNNGQCLHLRLQADVVAGVRPACNENTGGHLVCVHRHITEEVDVGHYVFSSEPVLRQCG